MAELQDLPALPASPFGHLGFRQEGIWWRCYYLLPDATGMNDARELGAILHHIAEQNPDAKVAFMDLMKLVFSGVARDVLGATTEVAWFKPVVAPEHERKKP